MSRSLRRLLAAVTVAVASITGVGPAVVGTAGADHTLGIYDSNGGQGSIYRLYRAYFLREPDYDGYQYWYGQFSRGYPITSVANDFAKSAEFQSDYGDIQGGAFVELVYNNVLERDPDQAGYDYWVDQMNRGMPRGNVMINFSDSAEFRSKTANGVPPGYRALRATKSGNNDQVFHFAFDRPTIAVASNDGDSNYIVRGLDGNGEWVDLIVNDIGPVSGTVNLVGDWRDIVYVDVSADGNWSLTFLPLTDATPLNLNGETGRKDDVRRVSVTQSRLVRVTHQGPSNFIIYGLDANGEREDLLVNEIGNTDVTVLVPGGIEYFEIMADGVWTVQPA